MSKLVTKALIPYQPIHAMWIIDARIRKYDLWLTEIPGCEEWPFKWAEHPGYTLFINGQIIMCGGVMLLGWQRGEAWTLMADGFEKYPIEVFRTCKHVVDAIAKGHSLRRVQAIVEPGTNGAIKFIERLGYQLEGTLRSFGPRGEDYLMYAKIIKES